MSSPDRSQLPETETARGNVHMRVVKARQHQPGRDLDRARVIANESADAFVIADVDDSTIADGNRSRGGICRVCRKDRSAAQHKLGG